jgi:hypothetical protein
MWARFKTRVKNTWNYILSWTRNSATVLWARIQGLVGLAIAAASAVDWSGIARLDWAHDKTSLYIGLGLIANALLTEVARRRSLDA